MSNLSELLPAGGAGKNVSFVASGTLPNGQAVALKSDGTVEAVTQTSTAKTRSIPASSETVFSGSNGATFTSIDFNPYTAGQFIISYQDITNSGYGTAVVGNVSGTTITFQTPVLWRSGAVSRNEIAFDPNTVGKFVIAFKSTSPNAASAIVGTISGNSISFGTVVDIESGGSEAILAFDPHTAGRCVVGWVTSSVNHGKVAVGTVSGTSISFGTSVVYNAAQSGNAQIKFDSLTANRLAVAYYDGGNSSAGTAIIGTLSGTNISFGSEFVFNSGATYFPGIAFSPHQANTFVVAYRDGSDSNRGNARVGTITGTSISYGTERLFNVTGDTNSIHTAFCHHTPHKFIIAYQDELNSNYGTLIEGTLVPGVDTITFGTEVVFNAAQTGRIGLAFDPSLSNAGMFIISYQDTGNSYYGTAILGQIATTAATNVSSFIGMADAAIADTAAGSVTIKGGLAKSISNVAIDVPATIGSSAVFLAGSTRKTAFVFDSNANKVICCYKDSGATNYATAIVGTVSGSAITFGTPVVISSNGYANEVRAVFDSNVNKVICVSLIGTSNARASVGTVSGTSISFGSEVIFNGSTTGLGQMAFDSTANKALISYRDDANSDAGTVVVATISGTSISFGAETVFESNQCSYPALIYDANANKTVLAYSHIGDSSKGKARIGTITGTSISFGAAVEFNTSSTSNCWGTFIPSTNKIFLAYTAANSGTGIVGTVSGTSISFGAPTTWETAGAGHLSVTLDSSTSKPIVAYYAAPTFHVVEATISGTSVSFNTPLATSTGSVEDGSCVYDSNSDKVVISYRDTPNSGHGTAAVYTPSSTLSTLVAGTDYYVQADGIISTTSTSPAVKLGKALSTTSINLEFNT